jgi:insulysin
MSDSKTNEPLATPLCTINEFVKGKLDTRQYRYLLLPNQMQTLLVSDPDAEFSSVSICVNVGTNNNPANYQGLAHFCEHMLFLGNTKYPNESDFLNFVIGHGGKRNASTSSTKTVYFLSIVNAFLESALDRLSQFFISPLFSESGTERELNAINSEYNNGISNDIRKKSSIIRYESNPNSIHHCFGCGNYETLKKEGVRESLLEFYNKYYSSNLMSLVIYSNANTDVLQAYCKYFIDIKNKNTVVSINQILPFEFCKTGLLFEFICTKDTPTIETRFMMPNYSKDYKEKSYTYISFLLGHEGNNSLLAYLIDCGLASGLSSGHRNYENEFDEIYVLISLTIQGLQMFEKVIEIVFAYINVVANKEPAHYLLQEIASLNEMDFQYKEKKAASVETNSLVEKLAKMNSSNVSDIIWAFNYNRSPFNKEKIKEMFKYLTPQNSITFVGSNSFTQEKCNLQDPWMKSKYCKSILSQGRITELSSIKVAPSPHGHMLDLPGPNPYIPTSFDLIPKQPPSDPKLIMKGPSFELWHRQYFAFEIPKVKITISIITNDLLLPIECERYISMKLYCDMFSDYAKNMLYNALESEITSKISLESLNKIRMEIKGYKDKIEVFISDYLKSFVGYNPKEYESMFTQMKDKLLLAIMGKYKISPYMIAESELSKYMTSGIPSDIQMVPLIKKLTFQRFLEITEWYLFKKAYIIMFAYGNISKEASQQIMTKIAESFKFMPIESIYQIELAKPLNIPSNSEYFSVQYLQNPKETNSAIVSYFQTASNINTHLKNELTNSVMVKMISGQAFDILRTQQQLGYVVKAITHKECYMPGLCFIIQSAKYVPEILYTKINEFIEQMNKHISEFPLSDFNHIIESLKNAYTEPIINSTSEEDEMSNEIFTHRLQFDIKKIKVQMLDTITHKDVVELYKQMFITNIKRFDLEYICEAHSLVQKEHEAKNKAAKTNRIKIENEREFKSIMQILPNSLQYYTFQNQAKLAQAEP